MATQKTRYYVLVFTDEGPVYVTSVNNASSYARWDKDKEPQAFPKYYAEDLVFGLNCNFIEAVIVASKVAIDYQPYNYKSYNCKFVRKMQEEADDD